MATAVVVVVVMRQQQVRLEQARGKVYQLEAAAIGKRREETRKWAFVQE
jgi:hypothetical protein